MKLKPCPFCGGKAFEYDDEPAIECLVGCCKCSGQECMGGAMWVYIDEWNTRPIEDKQAEQIERLKEKSECFTKVWQYLESEHKEIADEIQSVLVNGDMDLFLAAPPQKESE